MTTVGQIANLSRSGALVLASHLPRIHRPVRLRLREPHWQIEIESRGVVARVVHGRRPEDGAPAVGVWLRGLSGWHEYLIAELLRRRPPLWPTLRPRPAAESE